MHDMKTIVIFIICILIISSQGKKKKEPEEMKVEVNQRLQYKLKLSNQYQTKCMSEHGIKEDRVRKMEKDGLLWENVNVKERCYISCILEENDIVKRDGKLNIKKITAMMSKDIAETVKYSIKRLTKICHFLLIKGCSRNAYTFLIIMHILDEFRGIRIDTVFKPTYSARKIKEILQPCCKDDACSSLREM